MSKSKVVPIKPKPKKKPNAIARIMGFLALVQVILLRRGKK